MVFRALRGSRPRDRLFPLLRRLKEVNEMQVSCFLNIATLPENDCVYRLTRRFCRATGEKLSTSVHSRPSRPRRQWISAMYSYESPSALPVNISGRKRAATPTEQDSVPARGGPVRHQARVGGRKTKGNIIKRLSSPTVRSRPLSGRRSGCPRFLQTCHDLGLCLIDLAVNATGARQDRQQRVFDRRRHGRGRRRFEGPGALLAG